MILLRFLWLLIRILIVLLLIPAFMVGALLLLGLLLLPFIVPLALILAGAVLIAVGLAILF